MTSRLILLVTLIACMCEQVGASDQIKLRVVVTDAASTPPSLRAQAEARAALLLARAGIETSWQVCPASSTGTGGPGCAGAGPLSVWVRIVNSKQARFWPLDNATCGLALTGEPGEYGFIVVVNASCIDWIVQTRPQARATVLGHVIAHEIGHLLLGKNSHTGSGHMHAPWKQAEQALLVSGRLDFSPEDAARMRDALAARAAALSRGVQLHAGN